MTPCTTCKGSCPAPAACELPIQPSSAEITRDRIEVCLDRLEGWKDRAAIALAIFGLVLITASLAIANGCMRG